MTQLEREVEITLLGRIPSKKNTQEVMIHPRIQSAVKDLVRGKINRGTFSRRFYSGRPFIHIGNANYNKTKKGFVKQIKSQYSGSPLEGPLRVTAHIWGNQEKWRDLFSSGETIEKYSGWDGDNKVASLFDLLMAAKVYHDDCQITRFTVTKHFGKGLKDEEGNPSWGATIRIKEVPNV